MIGKHSAVCGSLERQLSGWKGEGFIFLFTVRYFFHRQDSRAFSHELMEYKD